MLQVILRNVPGKVQHLWWQSPVAVQKPTMKFICQQHLWLQSPVVAHNLLWQLYVCWFCDDSHQWLCKTYYEIYLSATFVIAVTSGCAKPTMKFICQQHLWLQSPVVAHNLLWQLYVCWFCDDSHQWLCKTYREIYLWATFVIAVTSSCTRKEGNVLFNDTFNTFYLRLYGVGHMVKYHSDSERKPAAATWATLSD